MRLAGSGIMWMKQDLTLNSVFQNVHNFCMLGKVTSHSHITYFRNAYKCIMFTY